MSNKILSNSDANINSQSLPSVETSFLSHEVVKSGAISGEKSLLAQPTQVTNFMDSASVLTAYFLQLEYDSPYFFYGLCICS